MKRTLIGATIIVASLMVSPVAMPQDYPSKPVRIVSPFAAGGTGEIVFRVIAPVLEARLGGKIYLEARPGAGGNIGAEAVAASAPDGYSLLLGVTTNFTVNPLLFPGKGFDPLRALTPITIVADVPSVFYAPASLPARDLREFVAYARANPGKLNYASAGNGTSGHLTVELLSQLAGLEMAHVPYKGLQPALSAVLAGEAHLYLAGLGAGHGLIKAGKVRALAVGSAKRLAAIPDTPTVSESGFPDFQASTRFLLAAPAGTTAGILNRWAREVHYAVNEPRARQRLDELAIVPVGNSPEEVAVEIRREAEVWKEVVRKGGIKAE
jgi:tripartite-type tricarboxylate transporter receptor subunit TctC